MRTFIIILRSCERVMENDKISLSYLFPYKKNENDIDFKCHHVK